MEKKKIGVLTFHRAINYGAFLQCYSLVNFIQKNLPDYKVEVIDYETPDEFLVRIKSFIRNLLRGKGIQWISMEKAFSRDLKRYLPVSKRRIVSSNYRSIQKWFNNEYVAIVVGSDAVWSKITNKSGLNYFLSGIQGCKKLSYAASLSGLNSARVDPQVEQVVKESLSSFDYIGVREVKGEHFIQSLLPQSKVYHNCDPTCFIDIDLIKHQVKLESKLSRMGIDGSKPIICLMTSNEVVGKYVYEEYHNTHFIVSLYVKNNYSDCFLYNLSPLEFASFFQCVNLLFSFFFHGCYLCLKNCKPVIAVDEGVEPDGEMTKINYLFNRLGMQDRYFRPKELDGNGFGRMIKKSRELLKPGQDKYIQKVLEEEKQFSSSFITALKESLS